MKTIPKNYIFLDGVFSPFENLTIDPSDRAWAFGDGVFTTIKVEKGIPGDLEAHLERVHAQASMLGIKSPKIDSQQVLPCVPEGDWRMKIVVTGGNRRSLGLPAGRFGQVIITFSPLSLVPPHFKICFYPYPIETPLFRIKSLAYLERQMVMQYALERGCDDAWVCDCKGNLLEGGCTNVYWTIGRDFFTPDPKLSFLFGLKVQSEVERHRSLGYAIHYVAISPKEISSKAQIFATNSLIGVVPVIKK